ncbi:hypothetical protein RHMOL_Rhmol05G0028100 [Rhododendron molle]|uniref:Uncharacterized protein n=1 Tax=Rhododendron molle TaxID=49168 RepID=A0ACC0NL30_RHOML|nr:hypothetical protein RHMOL_Rhmol05G0028100 [Rhododendron molle]
MGEDFDNSTQTYLIVLDRNSKKSTVDVDLSYLGGCMNISRHNARILYDSPAAASTSRSSARTAASISSRGCSTSPAHFRSSSTPKTCCKSATRSSTSSSPCATSSAARPTRSIRYRRRQGGSRRRAGGDRMMEELHSRGKTIEEITECLRRVPMNPRVISAIRKAHSLPRYFFLVSSFLFRK